MTQPAATWGMPPGPAPIAAHDFAASLGAPMSAPINVGVPGSSTEPGTAPQPTAAAPVFTAEDWAELRTLRHERAQREAREALDAAEAAARLSPPSHHVHLADGAVVEGSQLGTHHSYGDGTGSARGDRIVRVVGCYPL